MVHERVWGLFGKINLDELTLHSVLTFGCKKVQEIVSQQALVEYFPVFTLNPIRPCLA